MKVLAGLSLWRADGCLLCGHMATSLCSGILGFFYFNKDTSLDESPIPKALFQLNHLFRDLVSKYSLILLLRGKNFNMSILRVHSLAPSSMVTHDPH